MLNPQYAFETEHGKVPLDPTKEGAKVGLQFRRVGGLVCSNCALNITKAYGGSYCYTCFSTLARCDLCVMSPDRCHFHLGTCREPEWGESFCMQPHVVYLSNTSGPKVGITRAGREWRRWVDQGAREGLRLVTVPTRRAAGVVEDRLKRYVNDKTNWRKLVRGDYRAVELRPLALQLQTQLGNLVDLEAECLPHSEREHMQWAIDDTATEIQYPIKAYAPANKIDLQLDVQQDNLTGVIGNYLLFEQGVIHANELSRGDVSITMTDRVPTAHPGPQSSLF